MDNVMSIRKIVDLADRFRASYFFVPPAHAADRRRYEAMNSTPVVEWDEGGHHYTAQYTVSCSCRNVYARGCYTKDGVRTTLTAIKASLRRMEV